eukprot:INCI17583.5.p1 GENE.INCI17583.5~~INCI17583.5.p1  ORF type:complete len:625 (-),score=88.90 INCI17583.5:1412-3286(-)
MPRRLGDTRPGGAVALPIQLERKQHRRSTAFQQPRTAIVEAAFPVIEAVEQRQNARRVFRRVEMPNEQQLAMDGNNLDVQPEGAPLVPLLQKSAAATAAAPAAVGSRLPCRQFSSFCGWWCLGLALSAVVLGLYAASSGMVSGRTHTLLRPGSSLDEANLIGRHAVPHVSQFQISVSNSPHEASLPLNPLLVRGSGDSNASDETDASISDTDPELSLDILHLSSTEQGNDLHRSEAGTRSSAPHKRDTGDSVAQVMLPSNDAPVQSSAQQVHTRTIRILPFLNVTAGTLDAGDCALPPPQFVENKKLGDKGNQNPFCLPLMVCLGSAKSGTGELQRWLAHHPALLAGRCRSSATQCPPADGVGEVQFFNNLDTKCPNCLTGPPASRDSALIGRRANATRLVRSYLMANSGPKSEPYFFFNHIRQDQLGSVWNFEKSPHYLDSAEPAHLHAVMPSVRLVVLLRHPVRRLYSCWQHCFAQMLAADPASGINSVVKDTCGGTNFSTVLDTIFATARSKQPGKHVMAKKKAQVRKKFRKALRCVDQGNYTQHLARYLEVFPREQLLVVFHEDFVEDPFAIMDKVQAHAGIPYFDFRLVAEQKVDDEGRTCVHCVISVTYKRVVVVLLL